MSTSPTVLVKKGGALSALFTGFFGLLIVLVLCGTALGWYTINVFDRRAGDVLGIVEGGLDSLPQWRDSIPIVAELLDDHRSPDYFGQLKCSVRLLPSKGKHPGGRVLVTITNAGDEVVTLLTGRMVFLDEHGNPKGDRVLYLATPLAVDDEDWPGPLQSGAERQIVLPLWYEGLASAKLELTDVRVWNGPSDHAGRKVGEEPADES